MNTPEEVPAPQLERLLVGVAKTIARNRLDLAQVHISFDTIGTVAKAEVRGTTLPNSESVRYHSESLVIAGRDNKPAAHVDGPLMRIKDTASKTTKKKR